MADRKTANPERADSLKYTERIKKRRRAKRRVIWIRVLTVLLVLGVMVEAAVGIFALRFLQKNLEGMPVIHLNDFLSEESSYIYDGNGELITEMGTYYRKNINYEDCPESLIDAFLSIEDSRYFEHNGFDIPRFTKAVAETLIRRNTQGGSTFTMQLVKNTYFSVESSEEQTEREASIQYKIQQIWLSMQLELMADKKDVFVLYVNKVNFGEHIRGVEKAAQYYFDKHAKELNISESAMLAGIVNMPNAYNPYRHLDQATDRRNSVLYQMLNHGYITEAEYRLAKGIKVEDLLVGEGKMNVESTIYPSYLDAVIQEAQAMTGYDLASKGMQIYTALVPEIQRTIEDISNENSSVAFPDDLMQVAITSINNHNGEIVGISGGRNYTGGRSLNRATTGFKQPGSSVKPFLDYALAFEYLGFSLDEIVMDKPITFPAESRVLVNFNGEYVGDVTLREAVATSLNIPAILTLEKVTAAMGGQAVVDYLNTIGLTKANLDEYHMSYAIGGNQLVTTTTQMAGAHGMLANLGVYNQPHTIRKIIFSDGTEVYPENQNIRVLSAGSAWLTDQLMQFNVSGNFVNYMQILKRRYPVYAKTGTTDWGTDGVPYGIPVGAAKDKWMIASTSQYTNAVWIGYDMAVKNAGTYFPYWKSARNIPGRINSLLIDAEAEVSPDTIGGIERPEDVQDVTYVYGSYPHVQYEGWMGGAITSQVSTAGLEHVPTVTYGTLNTGAPELTNFFCSVANGITYVNWIAESSCSGGEQDISLHDYWNDIEETGACLADTTWVTNTNNSYAVDFYENDEYVTSVYSKKPTWSGIPYVFHGEVKACGYYTNGRGTSQTTCVSAGYFNPDE